MLAVHGVYAVRRADRVDHLLELSVHLGVRRERGDLLLGCGGRSSCHPDDTTDNVDPVDPVDGRSSSRRSVGSLLLDRGCSCGGLLLLVLLVLLVLLLLLLLLVERRGGSHYPLEGGEVELVLCGHLVEQLGGVLQGRGSGILVYPGDLRRAEIGGLGLKGEAGSSSSGARVSLLAGVEGVEVCEDAVDYLVVAEDRLLDAADFLEDHLVLDAGLGDALGEVLELLLLGEELRVEQVELLRGDGVFVGGRLLARRRRLSADVVERVLVVGLELGMFKLPRL